MRHLKKLLTKVNLLNPNSAIVYFGCYGVGVENKRRPDCLDWLLLFTRHCVLAMLLLDTGKGVPFFLYRPP
jgi:hypothetical protein